jgi:hypothetical protein
MRDQALDIYQAWLDTTGPAILRGDMGTVGRLIALPYVHGSPDGRQIIETRSDMEAGHLSYSETLRSLGVTQLLRLGVTAGFLGPDYLEGHHVIHALRDGVPMIAPFTSRMVLRNIGGVWKLTESQTAMRHGDWPTWVARHAGDPVTAQFAEDDVRRENIEPLVTYQLFLNRLTRANVSGDFDAFGALCETPFASHLAQDDILIRTDPEARRFFDVVSAILEEHGIEDFLRVSEHAQYISARELCGYHTSRFLVNGLDALEPITSRMILRRTDTRWRLVSVTNSVSYGTRNTSRRSPLPVLPAYRKIMERTKSWPNSH